MPTQSKVLNNRQIQKLLLAVMIFELVLIDMMLLVTNIYPCHSLEPMMYICSALTIANNASQLLDLVCHNNVDQSESSKSNLFRSRSSDWGTSATSTSCSSG